MIADLREDSYSIRYEDVFDGPIELLLELIQKKKLSIYDISLSYIIKGFTDYIKEKSSVLLETMSGFTYFASILLEIKSRSLIPSHKKDAAEEGELDINILKRREEEYRIYRKISNYIDSRIQEGSLFLIREAPIEKSLMHMLPDFMEEIDAVQLLSIAGSLLTRTNLELDLEDIYNHRSILNIFDEMERIKTLLAGRREVTFKEISSFHSRIIDRIVSFLSMLELYKTEEIEILQFESFGNIIIRFK